MLGESGEVVNSITVNFIKDGSTVRTTAVGDGMYLAGIPVVSKEGAVFAGWFYDEECKKAFSASEKILSSNKYVKNLTLNLYAKFTPDSSERGVNRSASRRARECNNCYY